MSITSTLNSEYNPQEGGMDCSLTEGKGVSGLYDVYHSFCLLEGRGWGLELAFMLHGRRLV